ncbi:uncharacterized protein N7500_005701 [Penicillium coprophilum]|uniref:uncharacterized protein n=1 Tax=Penicillium coprophilum TaxID=36646 RepID=UPI00238CE984|nr:uncharacterized protein N7500_005701 [Penicillium coprophilum]KAJ5163871.1 hypothetical protein N7500_005701 [Penicillium coprophilum]
MVADHVFPSLKKYTIHISMRRFYQRGPEPRTHLLEMSQISQGSWGEVDSMSSGLFSMMNIGIQTIQPKCIAGHPEVEFRVGYQISGSPFWEC